MDPAHFLADRISSIGSSGIRRVFDLAATMTNPIDLSMGQPDFDVPASVKQAAIDAINNDRNGYTVTHGLPQLRDRIARSLQEELHWSSPNIVTCGVSGGLSLALMACLNPGDEVVFPDPYFVSYKHLVNLFGGKPVPVSIYDDFRIDIAAIEAAITPRTKIILLNSPANPTGVVHSAAEIQGVAELAKKHDLLLISDEIYEMLAYDTKPVSPVAFAPEHTLLLRGFGKSYAITGWRMGYAAGPEPVIAQMAKLQQYTFVCAPQIAQWGALAAMDTDMSREIEIYRRKRDLAVDELRGAFEFASPGGGFYVFPKIPSRYETATHFVEESIKRNCLVIPGNVFSDRDTHFRISYAVPDERLKRGCEVLRSLAG